MLSSIGGGSLGFSGDFPSAEDVGTGGNWISLPMSIMASCSILVSSDFITTIRYKLLVSTPSIVKHSTINGLLTILVAGT